MIKIYEAIVTRVEDDTTIDLRGAVYFQCDQLIEDKEFPVPALPLFPHEFFSVPNVDDTIEIEIDESLEKPLVRWRSIIYNVVNEIPEEFQVNYPNRKGIKTKAGHLILFDDSDGEEFLKILHKIGTFFEIDKEGSWLETIIKNKIIEITNNHEITATNHILTGNIKLGSNSSNEPLVLGNAFSILYNAHMHIGNLGVPSGVPIQPLSASELSAKVFTEL